MSVGSATAVLGWLVLAEGIGAVTAPDLRLLRAAKDRDRAAIRELLQKHVPVDAAEADGSTALDWAAHWDDLETADLLVRAGTNVNAATTLGVTPLSLACENGSGLMVEKLLKAGANSQTALGTGETALMTCARTGSLEAVNAILARGANVNAKEHTNHQTALMWAVSRRHPEIVKALIEHGADLEARSRSYREFVARKMPGIGEQNGHTSAVWMEKGGSTPLLFAARAGDIECAQLLLAAGAQINETAPDGNTALLIAAHSGQTDLAIFLLDHGADPNAAGVGYTALHSAVLRSDLRLVNALLAHRANPNARLTNGTPIRRTDPDGLLLGDWAGATPFLLAAKFLLPEIMRTLVGAGAAQSIPMEDGTTPLMAAAGLAWANGFDRRSVYLVGGVMPPDEDAAAETAQLAISLGADVNAANQAGDTAMHGAAAKGYARVIQLLADSGAKPDVKNRRGMTPLNVAQTVKGQPVTNLLTKLSAKAP
jgi:ankyrin repeat protein